MRFGKTNYTLKILPIEIFTGVCGLIYGSSCALRGYKEHDLPWFVFGLLLAVTWCILLPYRIFKNNIDSEIPFQIIVKIELKKSWFGTSRTGRIITCDKKYRLIHIEEDEIVAKKLIEKLQAKNIQVIA